jgi:hypothetical protein
MAVAYLRLPMLCTSVIHGCRSALGRAVAATGHGFRDRHRQLQPGRHAGEPAGRKACISSAHKPAPARLAPGIPHRRPAVIERLTKAAGFRYALGRRHQAVRAPCGIIVLTPDGRLARYLFGIEYGPARLRFGIVEASAGKVGSVSTALLLYCYHYDPLTGRYGLVIMRVMRWPAGDRAGLAVHSLMLPARAAAWTRAAGAFAAIAAPLMWTAPRSFPKAPRRWAPRGALYFFLSAFSIFFSLLIAG